MKVRSSTSFINGFRWCKNTLELVFDLYVVLFGGGSVLGCCAGFEPVFIEVEEWSYQDLLAAFLSPCDSVAVRIFFHLDNNES